MNLKMPGFFRGILAATHLPSILFHPLANCQPWGLFQCSSFLHSCRGADACSGRQADYWADDSVYGYVYLYIQECMCIYEHLKIYCNGEFSIYHISTNNIPIYLYIYQLHFVSCTHVQTHTHMYTEIKKKKDTTNIYGRRKNGKIRLGRSRS